MSNKDVYGEVFTPIELVEELLEQLPKHVWTNDSLRWLDPCAGTGIFFTAVFDKLMDGLEYKFPDPRKRKQHILKNMLFMYEINPKSVKLLQKVFGKKANIDHNYLTDTSQETYDIILGNPPYQTPKVESYRGSVGNKTLWDKFLVQSMNKLSNGGYLGFITPANWRRPEHPLYKLLVKENRLEYLHVYSKNDGMKHFHVQTRFDLYLIKRTKNHVSNYNTTVIDEQGIVYDNFRPSLWPFIPNYAFPIIYKHLCKKEQEVIFSSTMYDARTLNTKKNNIYRYPIIHTITNDHIGILYAKERLGQIGIPKVILSFNEKQYPINDYSGKYGMSQICFALPIIKTNGDKRSYQEIGNDIIQKVSSKEFEMILKATKWGAFQTDYRMFKYIVL